MNTHDKHIFALHCPTLGRDRALEAERFFEYTDQALWHRITHVLRMAAGDQVILFNGTGQEITLALSEKMFTGKNKVSGVIQTTTTSAPHHPAITLMPSILKREAFETVVYLAAQMGATTVQPIIATKTQRAWHNDKEQARLTSIMIAACEQAKNFIIPELKNPIPLAEIETQESPRIKIYFEDTGKPLMAVAQELITKQAEHVALVFGPEGGLTNTEQQFLDTHGFLCCALTPTILRAQEAVAVGLGSIRSLLPSK